MSNRIDSYFKCEHYNLIPVWYISANIYIFWCQDCDIFILKDYLGLQE